MRFPLPDRFKAIHVTIFMAVLFLVQQIEGTEIIFSLLVAAYIVLFAAAFNIAGGMFYASGAFIFFNGTLTALVGLCYKAFLGEPAQTLLLSPNLTMSCYCGGMAAMGVAAFVSRGLRTKTGILAGMAAGEEMKKAAIGCFIVAVLIRTFAWGDIQETTSFASALRQLDRFGQMAILLATTYEINQSNGRRSTNWIVWSAGLYILFFGLVNYSKEGIFTSFVTWLIPCVVLGFNFSKRQLIVVALGIFFMFHYLAPYSQYVRNYAGATKAENIKVAMHYLGNLEETRRLYLAEIEAAELSGDPHFYKQPQGLFDRIQMLAFDDALIHRTQQGYVYGLTPTYESFANIIPRFLWPSKPNFQRGNDYGREIGVIQTEDTTTGISFSPIGDAYHQAEWFGVLLVLPLIMFLLFLVTDSLAGDVRRSPWGLLLIAISAHVAPEGLLSGAVYLSTTGSFGLIVIALLAKYVLPFVSSLTTGSRRTGGRVGGNFTPLTGRLQTLNVRDPDDSASLTS